MKSLGQSFEKFGTICCEKFGTRLRKVWDKAEKSLGQG